MKTVGRVLHCHRLERFGERSDEAANSFPVSSIPGKSTSLNPLLERQPVIVAVLSIDRHHELIRRWLARDLCGHACRQNHLIPCPSSRNAIRESGKYRHKQRIVIMLGLLRRAGNSAELLNVLDCPVVILRLHSSEKFVFLAACTRPKQHRRDTSVLTHT